jgi:hypothetical protein
MKAAIPLALCATLLACATEDTSGINVRRSTPDQFCRGTARGIAADRYAMKREGVPLGTVIEENGEVEVIDAITRAVYSRQPHSEDEARDIGTAACLAYFR